MLAHGVAHLLHGLLLHEVATTHVHSHRELLAREHHAWLLLPELLRLLHHNWVVRSAAKLVTLTLALVTLTHHSKAH